jgi:hypothetical protein
MAWKWFQRKKYASFTNTSGQPAPVAKADQFTEALVGGEAQSTRHVEAAPSPSGATPHYILPTKKRKTIACIVVHGMGQQVPFETAGMLAEAFVAGKLPRNVTANRERLTGDGNLLSRLEIEYDDSDGAPLDLHIYEGYWAPLTEGKVTFYESLRFLLSGASRGIKTCVSNWFKGQSGFSRWMFGEMESLGVKAGTLRDLLLTLLFLALGLVIAAAIEAELKHVWHLLGTLQFSSLFHLAFWPMVKGLLAVVVKYVPLAIALGIGAIYVYYLHYFVVQYVGDVAIYISSHKVSKFEEVRTAIQKSVFQVGSQVYRARTEIDSGPLLYDRVIIVGHSLGSVIAYDLLNALIVWDRMGCTGQWNVEGRTSNLITFGSPLDKTAFLFRTQISPEHHYREALAGLEQPLILDYRLRPPTFKWVNLYSKNDIVSGRLVYYDKAEPAPDQNRIENFEAKGLFPIVAHVQYWSKPDLHALLQDALWHPPNPHQSTSAVAYNGKGASAGLHL